MAKKKRKLYKTNQVTDTNYKKVVFIALGVIIVLGLVYFLTALAMGEIKLGKKEEKVKEETKIQYREIIAGETFNRNSTDYYVLFYKSSDVFADYYLSLINSYGNKDNSLPFYVVDLENFQNSEYELAEGEDAVTPKNIGNLKVQNPSIIRIRNSQVFDYINGKDAVLKFFNN